jgi:osmotically-inducible protein OsmY
VGVEVRESAEATLRGSGYSALRRIVCQYHDGLSILNGSVPTHYLKQMAQHLVTELEGVHRVSNQIEVLSAIRQGGAEPGFRER